MEPLVITDKNFSETLKQKTYVLIDFWATWCNPCKTMMQIIEESMEKYSKHILFGKLNIDDGPLKVSEFNILTLPTIILFKDEHPIDRFGSLSKKDLQQKLNQHLGL